jgi:predicted AAA+ superfamily ATPase
MFTRMLESEIGRASRQYRCVTLLGPRQSGKTTLSKKMFQDFEYFSLETPDTRERALVDPRGFLSSIRGSAVLDEVQRTPDLISYLQMILDDKKDKRRFILTGSNSLLLSEKISQSLAGRTRIFHILPLVPEELPLKKRPKKLNEALWMGLYPRIFDENLNPREWYGGYLQTYVEKDVRSLLKVNDLIEFERYLRLLAGRAACLVNHQQLATEAGISQPTAKSWLNVLQASFVVFSLAPHFKNFSRRLVKSPKIYFYDTGLLCYLLRITQADQLETHPLRGAIFENYVISCVVKTFFNKGEEPPVYFWRDQGGHEVDLILDRASHLQPIEIKSSKSFRAEFLKEVNWLNKRQQNSRGGVLVFGGDESFSFETNQVVSWKDISRLALG